MKFGIEGATPEFYKHIDYLKFNSHRKFPERPWSEWTYYAISLAWIDKKDQLIERVAKLKKEHEEEENP